MSKDLSTLCYVNEQVSLEDHNRDLGYTVHNTSDPARFYLKFPAVLQSFGVMNRNGRMYDAQNVWQQITESEYIQTMLNQNTWMGECDHPAEEIAGQKLSVQRIGNPDPKHTSHYIRKPKLDGNLLRANIQTDSGTAEGMNVAIKILDGGIVPAFSARVLGELQNRNGQPTVWVKKLITYDYVMYPSHPEALGDIQAKYESVEIVNTSNLIFLAELAKMAASSSKETEWICESFNLSQDDIIGLTSTGNSIVVKENKNIYIQPITDSIVRNKTQKAIRDFINS